MSSGREASRLRTLRRIIAGLPDAVSSMRPAIWPAEYGDEHSGIRRLESRWAAAWDHRQQLQPQPGASGPSRIRGAPDPSTDAPWMHRSQPRPAPVRDRRPPQPLPAAPAQPAELTPRQRVRAALRSDDTDIASLAEAHPSSPEWAHTWRAATSAALDRPGRVVVWRLLHGKLFVGAFHRHIHRGTPESHLCPHAALPGAAGHPQPRHAQLPSLSGGLAVVCSHMDSSDPAASTSTACRSPASRRQAWSLAACCRTGQLVAATSLAGHHAAVGCLLPRQITARAADAAGAHRSESHLCSQDPDAARLAACRLRHQAPGWGAQPLAQRTAAHHDC